MPIIQQDVDFMYGKEGPTPKQIIFRDAPHKYKLFGGGVGGGKSVALCAEALRLSLYYAGNRGFLGRHEAEALRRTTLVTMFSLIAKIEEVIHEKIVERHNKSDKEIHLLNGSVIMYGGLGGPDDKDRIKSLEIGWFCVDEASETNLDVNLMLRARLRWQLPGGQYPRYFGMYASNPEPGWVKDTFVTPQSNGSPLEGHIFVQSLLKDNPWLPEDYISELKRDNPADWVERYVEGSWEAMEGQIWKGFSFQNHVFPNPRYPDVIIPPFNEVTERYKVAGLDHGQTNPTAALFGYVDDDDNIFICDEYYDKGIASEHCKAINNMVDTDTLDEFVADPSMWGKRGEKNNDPWSAADEYDEHGIILTQANNDVGAGINRVSEYLVVSPLHLHPLLHDDEGSPRKGAPRLFISARCVNLIKEIQDYIWAKKLNDNVNAKEEPRKLNDHACDALRYLVMTRPSPNAEKQKETKPGTFDWYMEQKIHNRSLEKEGYLVNAEYMSNVDYLEDGRLFLLDEEIDG